MDRFDRMRQTEPLTQDLESAAAPDLSTTPTSAAAFLQRRAVRALESIDGRWRVMIETALIAVAALVLSCVFLWATLTDRISVEAIVVMMLILILSMVTVGQGMSYHTHNLSLQERARESVAKTTRAVEIMMDFLREFTLLNQATISQLVEGHKVRVIGELRQMVAALGHSIGDGRLRPELAQLEEAIARKIREIPAGMAFPLPRLEYFDQALRHLQEPESTPQCPTCGATRARLNDLDGREGIHYTCNHCGHEFSVGITVMLEHHSGDDPLK
jgi:predicted RNA-binding Zn-ribbon protein involved in translation (DUF1610 family)